MASLQLGMRASTLHHWAGIGDGRHSFEKLTELFDNDDNYASARQRIVSPECLVIDEISMLSKRVFEMVEYVCRHVKRSDLCFGGMQVIGCGDFMQLPPVPNKFLNDDGEYCFSSLLFDLAFPHHVHLTEVIRQKEQDLAKAVEELCDGSPSDATIDLLGSLSDNPDVPQEGLTRLYGTNFDVRFVNEEMLDELEGEVEVFKAKDEGNKNLLLRSPIPKTLLLKEGAPVILIKNLAGRLFNGQRGIVYKLSNGLPPVINFNGELHEMKPEIFEIFDASQNKILASRSQIPIILAFAMTVHRAQGQTIENLEIDSSSFFAPGQLGVAIGRAVCKKGLSIKNLNMTAAFMKHQSSVYEFYDKPFNAVEADLSCCSGILGECIDEHSNKHAVRRTYIFLARNRYRTMVRNGTTTFSLPI
ncbi:uncharacterized protein LOC123537946 [Mercenaria mercenaria]|uniref:uncharacterized protein LOC123537946 n=1 Tax=Mercenaria mercenaria TaxID=6596 RepID=UPI00234F5973|nr:uncharacterized protein LOC123537946 [Mercenaria mercenaria]